MRLKFTYLGCYTECVYETKIHDIDNLRKCLTQISFFTLTRTLSTLRLTSDATVCIRSCVCGGADTLNTCSEMNLHLYDLPEHFMKLSMQFYARNGYFVVNIKS